MLVEILEHDELRVGGPRGSTAQEKISLMNENDRQAPGLGVCHKIDDNDLRTSVDKLMLIRSTNHRTKNLINKAKPIKQPLTNPG